MLGSQALRPFHQPKQMLSVKAVLVGLLLSGQRKRQEAVPTLISTAFLYKGSSVYSCLVEVEDRIHVCCCCYSWGMSV
jgi:hypothetical protein